jgi:D-ornithine---citrate ligase
MKNKTNEEIVNLVSDLNIKKLATTLVKEKLIKNEDVKNIDKYANQKDKINLIINKTTLKEDYKQQIKYFFNISNNLAIKSYLRIQKHNPTDKGQLLEKYCWSGHNTYPFPKLIIGLNKNEEKLYFKKYVSKLSILIVQKEKVHFSSTKNYTYDKFLLSYFPNLIKEIGKNYKLKSNETFIPIHIYQERHDPLLKKFIKQNKLIVIHVEYPYFMLTSTRTIFVLKDKLCLKLPVNLKITSELRLISQSYCHNAPIFSDIMKQIIVTDKTINKLFAIAPDIASVYHTDYKISKHLDVIFRKAILSKNTFPANFLFEVIDLKSNRRNIESIYNYIFNNEKKVNDFFMKYIYTLLYGPIVLFIKYGIAVEPHLQNCFIEFDNKGFAKKIILRDIDGININLAILSNNINLDKYDFHPYTKDLFKPDIFSATKIWHSLIYNHVRELVLIISTNYHIDEKILWDEVKHIINRILIDLQNDRITATRVRMFRKYFLSKGVDTKALLLMKLSESESFKIVKVKNFLYQ